MIIMITTIMIIMIITVLKILFGGGRRMFTPHWVQDPETGQPGLRKDSDLIAEWSADKVLWHFISTRFATCSS